MDKDLVFEPSEFEIIETQEFEEELQRPEEVRFFTLEEQLEDYYDKVLPKKKHIARSEYKKIENELDRLKKVYDENIVITTTDYRVDQSRKSVTVPWVSSIYAPFKYEKYSFRDSWIPLLDKSRRTAPNFYGPMISALPRPYHSEGGDGVPINGSQTLVNDEGKIPINALGSYTRTKRALHEDGSFDIISVPMPNSADDVKYIGYYINQRPLEIPRPLMDHPFLASNNTSKYITAEPLNTIFPSTEAIMSHAVPTTTDPYVEGQKYLKLYDVKLSHIPWVSWKERFPPVDSILSPPPIISVKFPDSDDSMAPSEDLQKSYSIGWNKGIFPRFWLAKQEDSGQLIVKMLLSKAGDFGLVPPETPGEKPEVQLPPSMPDDCLKTDNFEEFLASGVYRVKNVDIKKFDPYTTNPGVCAPTSYVAQEKQELVSKGKKAWSETTPTDIMKQHQLLLKVFQSSVEKVVAPVYEKFEVRDTSEMRTNVRIILNDPNLEPSDKLHNINLLVRDLSITDNKYFDASNLYVVCLHTLAQLGGDLEHDRLEFYNKWAAVVDGFRVCKYCSEQINSDTYVSQDDFDDNGNPIVSHGVLDEKAVYHGESHPVSFTNSLMELKANFDASNAGEAVLYTILSILQVLPTESQLLPIIQNLREVATAARRSAKLSVPDKRRVEGILGIAAAVVLLQTHNPFLIPRRSFGSKILKLSGFPRDTTDPKDSPVLDAVLYSIKSTFEAFPNTFKEPIATVLRAIKTNSRKVRDETVRYVSQAYTKFKSDFEAAKARYSVNEKEAEVNDILLPQILPSKYEFAPNERFGIEKMGECNTQKPFVVLSGKFAPSLVQDKLELWKSLTPSKSAKEIVPEKFKYAYMFPDSKEITRMFKLGFPKSVKLDAIENFIKSDTDGIALLSLLNRVLDIVSTLGYPVKYVIPYRQFATSLNTRESSSLVRDAVRGMLYELFTSIKGEDKIIEGLRSAMNRDLTLRLIIVKKEDAEKEVNMTRTKERETFKMRMRSMNDDQREITKRLLDIGIAPFIITNEDREIFAREYNYQEPEIVKGNADEPEFDEEAPEGGFTRRDGEDQDELGDNGLPVEVDYGDYGDKADRPLDDYSNTGGQFDFDEGDGI
jgi:hypothetical protein